MRIFFIFLFLMIAGSAAQAQDVRTERVINDTFQAAISAVAKAELEAPEASRVYALMAITLYDSYYASQNKPFYKAQTSAKTGLEIPSYMAAAGQALLSHLFSEPPITLSAEASIELETAERFVIEILAALPKPQPEVQISRETGEPLVLPEWENAPLLELSTPDQYRPNGPPSFDSAEFRSALKAVRQYGEDVSELRLADASLSAAFWGNPAGTMTPPGHWNIIALEALKGRSITEQLDVLLSLNIALYDAGIAAWDSKYYFAFIRPHAYLRENDPENSNWNAMGTVPLHPEYVSGHSAFSGAAAEVLTAFLGNAPFCNKSKDMWNLERCFASFTHAAEDAGQSRIYGGLHFDFSNHDGLTLGKNVGRHTLTKLAKKGVIKLSKTD